MSRLIEAAIALAWSEVGTSAQLLGDADWREMYEPWPAMDELLAALDEVRPGWRDLPRCLT